MIEMLIVPAPLFVLFATCVAIAFLSIYLDSVAACRAFEAGEKKGRKRSCKELLRLLTSKHP